MEMKQPKKKPCKNCLKVFQPYNSLQQCCNIPCSVAYTRMKAEKAEKRRQRAVQAETNRSHREAKERLRTRSDHLSLAQMAFNKYIRLRDRAEFRKKGLPDMCICCDKRYIGQFHAGHYLSVGANPELRFTEDNCHLQKSSCNSWRSGNQAKYRIQLIKKIGLERVEWLEGPHPPLKLTIDEIKAIKVKYAKLARQLEREL